MVDISYKPEGFWSYLSQLTPLALAIGGYFKLMLYGDGLMDILPNILALHVFAVVFFVIAIWRLRFDQ